MAATGTEGDRSVAGWFTPRLDYEGSGTLRLGSGARVIRGSARVSIGEDGRTEAEIEVVEQLPAGSASDTAQAGSGLSIGQAATTAVRATPKIPLEIEGLTIETPGGTFSTTGPCYWHRRIGKGRPAHARDVITLQLTHSVFSAKQAYQPRYWVIPLVNFVSAYPESPHHLGDHVLRVRPSPPPDEADPSRALEKCGIVAAEGVILFRFGELVGFIEPLPDHEERERKLKTEEASRLITAIMVGEVGGNSIEWTELEEWLPFDFGDLLSLASGTPTTIPWVEFRASDGQLVARFHLHADPEPFVQGEQAIFGGVGTGRLLSCAARSRYFRGSEMRVAIRLILRARQRSPTLDDDLRNLLIALEALYELILSDKRPSKANEVLGETDLQQYRKVFADARTAVELLCQDFASSRCDVNVKRFLRGAINKLANFDTLEPGFGTKVKLLLEDLDLPDLSVLDRFFRAHPERVGGEECRKWAEVLSKYRGKVMHRGYVGIGEKDFCTENAVRVSRHLQDVLLRVILKKLGYDGQYWPAVLSWAACEALDWVTDDTPPDLLGFRA